MKDIHKIFTTFKKEFPRVYSGHEALGASLLVSLAEDI